jgi:predicted Zn-dependent peptidase
MSARPVLAVLAAAALLGAPVREAHARAHSVEEARATAGPLRLKKQSPERFELKNGIPVYQLESDRLPLVTVRAVVRAGAVWEPADRQGVADLTGRMMRRGGTAKWSADEVDDELDFLAARLSSAVGSQQGNLTLNVLAENLDEALAIFADMLREPAFDAAKIDVQKNLIKEEIRRQNDNPVQVAVREYMKLVWGADHPRARTPTEATVDALTRQDLVDFHARFFEPGNVMIGVAGDVSQKEIRKKLNAVLGDWTGSTVEFPDLPPAPEVVPRAALARKDVPQSTVILGQLGPRETSPYRASGQVMMDILGSGGFTSYIVDRVRNDEGLAYFAGGFLSFGRLDPGMVITLALSKTESTCRAADLILEQIHRIQNEPVTDAELRRARDGILNSQAFEYDSGQEIVGKLMDLIYFDLPEDHDEAVLEDVAAVTVDDVRAAANALIDPERLSVIAVGNADGMDCAWSKFADDLGVELREIELE